MRRKMNLTERSPFKTLLLFSLPMLLSVTLQQFYNICDSLIAGNLIKDAGDSLAAINASYPITMIYLAIATGFGVGVNIIVARFVGERNNKSVCETVSTAVISIVLFSILLALVGILITEPVLKAINVNDAYLEKAAIYLNWYTLGLIFLLLYNTVTNVFQALGKSMIPLYLLIFSTALNIGLDIWFVLEFNMGIRGIAIATFIAQGLACIISFIIMLFYVKKNYGTEKFRFYNFEMLKKILPVAIPSIIQASIISFGQLMIQSKVNGLDKEIPGAVAGYGSAYKICYVIVNIYTMMSNAISTFTSQNAGAKKFDRIKKGFKAGFILCFILTIITTAVFLICPEPLLSIFNTSGTASEGFTIIGKKFIYYVAPFFILLCIKIPCDGVLKGSKDMRSFMFGTLLDLVIRVGLTYILEPHFGADGIFISWPIGWLFGMASAVICYKIGRWKKLIKYEENETVEMA